MCSKVLLEGVLFCLITFVLKLLYAQEDHFEFKRLSIEHGLPHNNVYSIMQDSRGFLWFGTRDGLARYDGNSFKVYRHDPTDSTSLSNSWIKLIYEDSFHSLWICTDYGLSKFDHYSETFTRYLPDPSDSTKLSGPLVRAIHEDHTGSLWFTNWGGRSRDFGGLYRLDRRNDRLTRYQHDPDNPNSLSENWLRCIVEDDSGALWIGSESHGLNRFNPATQTFTRYLHNPDNPNSLSHNFAWGAIKDRDGNLWFATFGGGLNRYDPESDGFVHYKPDPKDRNSLYLINVYSLFLDSSGIIWISNGVLSRLDPRTEIFTHYQISKNQNDWRSSFAPSVIYEDRSENLWIGTNGSGVMKVDRKPKKFKHYKHDPENTNSLSDDDIRFMHEARDGMLWLGTRQDGVNRFDPALEQFTHFKHDSSDPRSLSNNRIFAIHEDHSGTIWLGTDVGLNRFDPASKNFTRYLHDPDDPFSISDNLIATIYESRNDGKARLWIGTGWGGLNAFNPETESFVHYKFDPDAPPGSRANEINAIHEDQFGNLLLSKWPNQLYLFDRRKKEFVHIKTKQDDNPGWGGLFFEDRMGGIWGVDCGLTKLDIKNKQFVRYRIEPNDDHDIGFDFAYNAITSIFEDANGMLWCGTRTGLHLFDPQTNHFIRHYYEKDGLPSNLIYKIVGDDFGYIWVITGGGLSILNDMNPPGKKFRNFDVDDGIVNTPSQPYWNSLVKSKRGDIYWSGSNGLYRFYPEYFKENVHINTHVPAIGFTGFNVLNQPTTLDTSINEVREINLRYDQNFFSFEFAALDYTNPKQNQHAYKLQGFDKDWIATGNGHTANYTYIPPGVYTFRVKGSNNDGVWNKEGASVKIIISPPFWQTWWFRLSALLAMAAILFAGHKYRVAKILEVESTRNRIARDLHDEIGSSLSSIALTAEMIEHEPKLGHKARKQLRRIHSSAKGLIEALREIVWSIDPEHDKLEDLLLHMKDAANELLGQGQIRYHLCFPKKEFLNKLNMEFRHTLFLTYKELLHNICKHSEATNVEISLEKSNGYLILKVTDNGKGFDPITATNGNGLKSIQSRSQEINGNIVIESKTNYGTTVTLRAKIP